MAPPWRTAPLPPDWPQVREIARERAGGRCQHVTGGRRCTRRGTDCHHVGDNTDHNPDNLQWLCGPHHDRITGQQARATYLARTRRPREPHPGFIH